MHTSGGTEESWSRDLKMTFSPAKVTEQEGNPAPFLIKAPGFEPPQNPEPPLWREITSYVLGRPSVTLQLKEEENIPAPASLISQGGGACLRCRILRQTAQLQPEYSSLSNGAAGV